MEVIQICKSNHAAHLPKGTSGQSKIAQQFLPTFSCLYPYVPEVPSSIFFSFVSDSRATSAQASFLILSLGLPDLKCRFRFGVLTQEYQCFGSKTREQGASDVCNFILRSLLHLERRAGKNN